VGVVFNHNYSQGAYIMVSTNDSSEFINQVSATVFLFTSYRSEEDKAKLELLKTEYPDVVSAAEFLYKYAEKKAHPMLHVFSSVNSIIKDYVNSNPSRVLEPSECGPALDAYVSLQNHGERRQPLFCGSVECGQRYKDAMMSVGKDLTAYLMRGAARATDTISLGGLPTKEQVLERIKRGKVDLQTVKPSGVQELVIKKVVSSCLSNIGRKSLDVNPDSFNNAVFRFNEAMAEIVNTHTIRPEFRDSLFSGAEDCIRKMTFSEDKKDKIDDLLRYIPNSRFDELGGVSVVADNSDKQKSRMS
jgi:hypothetical protein